MASSEHGDDLPQPQVQYVEPRDGDGRRARRGPRHGAVPEDPARRGDAARHHRQAGGSGHRPRPPRRDLGAARPHRRRRGRPRIRWSRCSSPTRSCCSARSSSRATGRSSAARRTACASCWRARRAPSAADRPEDQQQQDRPERGDEDRADVELVDALVPGPLHQRPADQRAEHADGDRVEAAAAVVPDDRTGRAARRTARRRSTTGCSPEDGSGVSRRFGRRWRRPADERDDGSSVPALPSTAAAGRCCARCCPASARGLLLGVFAGLLWGAGKVAVPTLTRLAIDHGIIGHESLWFWSAMIAVAAVVIGMFTGMAALAGVQREPAHRDPPARPAVRALPASAPRLPRPHPDRPADEPGVERPDADPGLRRDDPADAVQPGDGRRRRRPAAHLPAAARAGRPRPAAAGQRARPALLPQDPPGGARRPGRAGRSWPPWSRSRSAACG